MEIWAAEHLDTGPLGKQPAETAAPERVENARQVKSAFLVKQPFARLDMLLDPIDDPQQAGEGRLDRNGSPTNGATRIASTSDLRLSPGKTTVLRRRRAPRERPSDAAALEPIVADATRSWNRTSAATAPAATPGP